MALHIELSWDDGTARVSVQGDLDLATIDLFNERMAEVLAGLPGEVVVDLREIGFIDSSGLKALWDLHRRAEGLGSCLFLVRGSERVHRVFEISGLVRRLRFLDQPVEPRA